MNSRERRLAELPVAPARVETQSSDALRNGFADTLYRWLGEPMERHAEVCQRFLLDARESTLPLHILIVDYTDELTVAHAESTMAKRLFNLLCDDADNSIGRVVLTLMDFRAQSEREVVSDVMYPAGTGGYREYLAEYERAGKARFLERGGGLAWMMRLAQEYQTGVRKALERESDSALAETRALMDLERERERA